MYNLFCNHKVILLYLLFLLIEPIFAYEKTDSNQFSLEYVNTNFTTEDGLPSNEIYCVFQDSKGFIWVGTDKGVARYDGYSFITYTTQDGLTDNLIFGIVEDSKGNIWFTTSNVTLCYFHPEKGIQQYLYNDKLKYETDVLLPDQVSVYYDQIKVGQNDTLYISNHRFNYAVIPLNSPGEIIFPAHNKFTDSKLSIVKEVNYQNIFVKGLYGLVMDKEWSIEVNDILLKKYKHNYRFYYHERPYCIDSNTYYFGKRFFDISNGNKVVEKKIDHKVHIFRVGDQFIINELDDGDTKGTVYLGSNVYDRSGWKKILNNKIRVVPSIVDNNGGLWIGSLEQGLFYVPNLYAKVVIDELNLRGIIPYKEGVLFNNRGSDNYYYENGIKLTKLLGRADIREIPVNHFIEFVKLSHAYNFGYRSYDEYEYNKLSVRLLGVSGGSLYLVTRDGVLKQNEEKNINFLFRTQSLINSVSFIDSNRIAVGTDEGIFLYKDDYLESYLIEGEWNYKPYDIKYIKSHSILAIATVGNGLFLFKDRKLYKQITESEGLVSNTINQLYLDNNEHLWIGTNKGINYLRIDSNQNVKIHNLFTSSKSLLSPNVLQMYPVNDSIMLIGTDKGVNEFNVRYLDSVSSYEIPTFITNISVNDTLPFNEKLNYKENDVVFEFTAIEYNEYGNIDYKYRLIGHTSQWIYTKERKASFFNLPPAKYTFELQVKDRYGKWVPLKDKYHFRIDHPYWKKWWFIGSYILLALLIVVGILYYYISNLRKEKLLIEDKQILFDELNESRQMALNSQLNPHFVFNSLNSIQNFILTNRRDLSSDYLSMFSKLMRFVFENSKNLYVSLLDEIEALRLYLDLEQVRHNHKFTYKILYDQLEVNTERIPSLLVQPIIENAIWHGLMHKQTGDCMLLVSFTKDNLYLNILVEDNGVGRQFSKPRPKFIKKQKSSGVELTQQRLNLLSQSTGLKTKFEVVDLFDKENNPRGTKVIISIPLNLLEASK